MSLVFLYAWVMWFDCLFREILENRIKRYQEKIVSNEDTVKKLSSSLSYFENIAPRITQSADEPCVICLDNIVSLTVTPCGHLFCKKCIIPCVQQQEMCPTCRKHITESELVEVKVCMRMFNDFVKKFHYNTAICTFI